MYFYIYRPCFMIAILPWTNRIVLVLFFAFFRTSVKCQSPVMAPNPRYFSTGMFQIATFTPIQNFLIPLGSFSKSLANYDVGLSMSSLYLEFSVRNLALQMTVVTTSQSSFIVFLFNPNNAALQALTINYITKQPSYVDAFYIKTFRSLTSTQNLLVTSGSGDQFIQSYHGEIIPDLLSVVSKVFLSGFDISSTNSGIANNFDLSISCDSVNDTHFVTKFSTNYDDYTINFYQIVAIFYDYTTVQNTKLSDFIPMSTSSFIDDTTLEFTHATTGFIQQYNVFMGIVAFHVQQTGGFDNFISFDSIITGGSTVLDITTTNDITGKFMSFQAILILSWSCVGTTFPWFDMITKTCISNTACAAPSYFTQNGMCISCSSHLANCNTCVYLTSANIPCTNCTSTYALNTLGACQLCYSVITQCQQCTITPITACTMCNAYHVNISGTCTLDCTLGHPQCLTCQLIGRVSCLTCNTGYLLIAPNVCDLDCLAVDVNCVSCSIINSTVQCTACVTDYTVFNNTCVLDCSLVSSHCSVCSIPVSVMICASCQLGYSLLSTPSCSICLSDYYNDSVNCSPCLPQCAQCQGTNNNCSQCRSYNSSNYYLLGNSCLTQCPSNYLSVNISLTCQCIVILPNGQCQPTISSSCTNNRQQQYKNIVIGLSIAIFVLLIILIILLALFLDRKKDKSQKGQNQNSVVQNNSVNQRLRNPRNLRTVSPSLNNQTPNQTSSIIKQVQSFHIFSGQRQSPHNPAPQYRNHQINNFLQQSRYPISNIRQNQLVQQQSIKQNVHDQAQAKQQDNSNMFLNQSKNSIMVNRKYRYNLNRKNKNAIQSSNKNFNQENQISNQLQARFQNSYFNSNSIIDTSKSGLDSKLKITVFNDPDDEIQIVEGGNHQDVVIFQQHESKRKSIQSFEGEIIDDFSYKIYQKQPQSNRRKKRKSKQQERLDSLEVFKIEQQ